MIEHFRLVKYCNLPRWCSLRMMSSSKAVDGPQNPDEISLASIPSAENIERTHTLCETNIAIEHGHRKS